MELSPNLHAFQWTSPSANNCNTYLLLSSEKKILIDPGHTAHFDHVRLGLQQLGMSIDAQWLLSGHGDMVAGADAVKANFEQVERMWFAYI